MQYIVNSTGKVLIGFSLPHRKCRYYSVDKAGIHPVTGAYPGYILSNVVSNLRIWIFY